MKPPWERRQLRGKKAGRNRSHAEKLAQLGKDLWYVIDHVLLREDLVAGDRYRVFEDFGGLGCVADQGVHNDGESGSSDVADPLRHSWAVRVHFVTHDDSVRTVLFHFFAEVIGALSPDGDDAEDRASQVLYRQPDHVEDVSTFTVDERD